MSLTPYRELPVDKNGAASQGSPPPYVGLQRFTSENALVSSVVTLNDNTTVLEVEASVAPAVLRWVASSDTQGSVISIAGSTSNYDVIVPAGAVRRIAIPIERQGVSSIVGMGVQAGLYRRVAWKTTAIGSIMSVEY